MTGGDFKMAQCFFYAVDQSCNNGTWSFSSSNNMRLQVFTAAGDYQEMENLPLTESKKILGVYDSPDKGYMAHLSFMEEKAALWLLKIKRSYLPRASTWVAYYLQLCPGLRYGIGTLSNTLREGQDILSQLDYRLLPSLGICRNIPKELRRISFTFGGFGLFNFPVEQFIQRAHLFLQHFGTPSTLGMKLDAAMEALQLHLGCSSNPLSLDYDTWSFLAPECWLKCFWESTHHFNVLLKAHNHLLLPPRQHDTTIMSLVLSSGMPRLSICGIYRCRIYKRCIFLTL